MVQRRTTRKRNTKRRNTKRRNTKRRTTRRRNTRKRTKYKYTKRRRSSNRILRKTKKLPLSQTGGVESNVPYVLISDERRQSPRQLANNQLLLDFLKRNNLEKYYTTLLNSGFDYSSLFMIENESEMEHITETVGEDNDLVASIKKEKALLEAGIIELNHAEFVAMCREDKSPELLISVVVRHSSIIAGEQFEIPTGVKHFVKGSFDKITYGHVDEDRIKWKLLYVRRINQEYQRLLNNGLLFNKSGCPNTELIKIEEELAPGAPRVAILNINFHIYEGGTDEGKVVNDMLLPGDYLFGLLFVSTETSLTYFLSFNKTGINFNLPDSASQLYSRELIPLQQEIDKSVIFYFDTCRIIEGEGNSELSRVLSKKNDKSKKCFMDKNYFEGYPDKIKSAIYAKIEACDNMTEFYYTIATTEEGQKILSDAIVENNKGIIANFIYISLFPQGYQES